MTCIRNLILTSVSTELFPHAYFNLLCLVAHRSKYLKYNFHYGFLSEPTWSLINRNEEIIMTNLEFKMENWSQNAQILRDKENML